MLVLTAAEPKPPWSCAPAIPQPTAALCLAPLNCNSDRTAAAKTLTDTLAWLAAQPEGLAGCDGLCIGSAGISNPDAYNFIQDIIRAGGYTGPLQIVGDQVTPLAVPWASRWALC